MTKTRLQRTSPGLLCGWLLILFGATTAQSVPVSFQWTAPRTGASVDHYVVYTSRDGEAYRIEATSRDTVWVLNAEVGVEYRVKVAGVSAAGLEGLASLPSDPLSLPEQEQQDDGPPSSPGFLPNVPNPFNPSTIIRYGIPLSADGSRIALALFDIRGQLVRTFQPSNQAGWHDVEWNGLDDLGNKVSSGPYIVRLIAGGRVSTWKITMVK